MELYEFQKKWLEELKERKFVFPLRKFDYSSVYISLKAMKYLIKWGKEDSMKEYDDLYIVYGGEA